MVGLPKDNLIGGQSWCLEGQKGPLEGGGALRDRSLILRYIYCKFGGGEIS